jgi:hypothetical protein
VQLRGDLAAASGVDHLEFDFQVLAVLKPTEAPRGEHRAPPGWHWYRCRNVSPEGTEAYERAVRVVFAAERARRALDTGTDEASGMVTPRKRRADKRPGSGDRYGRSNVNPLFDE